MRIAQAKRVARRYLTENTPAFLWGAPGIGKSDLVREIAAEDYDGNIIDFRALLRDPVDLRGLPSVAGSTAKWLVPDDLPQEKRDGKRGLFFMDELNAAPASMQAACFGLVLDRKVGNYTLPPGWKIIAAGNRQTDGAAAQRMPTALADRFAHIDIEAHVDDTVAWGVRNNIEPMLLAFLRFRPQLLHDMSGPDKRSFPTPRSWMQAAKYFNDTEDRLDLIAGNVGMGAATEAEGFIRIYKDLPSLDLVIANPAGAPLVTEPSARFAMTFGLSRKAETKNIGRCMEYVRRFKSREFEIMFMVDATRRDAGLSHTQEFVDWHARNEDVILG